MSFPFWNVQPESHSKEKSPTLSSKQKYPQTNKHKMFDRGQVHNPYTEIQILEGHKDIVRQLLKIDNKRCASAAEDATVIIWNIEMGQKLLTLAGHILPITCMLLLDLRTGDSSRDGSLILLTGSSDRQIRVWDIENGVCQKMITDHSASIRCLIPLNDNLFCSGGQGMCVWDQNGILLHKYKRGQEEAPIFMMISIKKDRIVIAADKQLEVYSLENGETEELSTISFVRKLPPHRESVKSLINISEGSFASGSLDGTVIMWSAQTLVPSQYFNSMTEYKGSEQNYPYSIQHMFCVDERYIFVALGSGFCLYDVITKKVLSRMIMAHYSKILYMGFVCDGNFLATCSEDGSLRLWGHDPSNNDEVEKSRPEVSNIEKYLGLSYQQLKNLSPDNNMEPKLLGECLGHSGAVQMFVDFDGEGIVTCGVDQLVIIWKNHEVQQMKQSICVLELLQKSSQIV